MLVQFDQADSDDALTDNRFWTNEGSGYSLAEVVRSEAQTRSCNTTSHARVRPLAGGVPLRLIVVGKNVWVVDSQGKKDQNEHMA